MKRRGLTFWETLAVIVIIAILSAIAVPNFIKARYAHAQAAKGAKGWHAGLAERIGEYKQKVRVGELPLTLSGNPVTKNGVVTAAFTPAGYPTSTLELPEDSNDGKILSGLKTGDAIRLQTDLSGQGALRFHYPAAPTHTGIQPDVERVRLLIEAAP